MPFVIRCGGCKGKLRIPDTALGKIVKCPQCARKTRLPAQLKSAGKHVTKGKQAATSVVNSKPATAVASKTTLEGSGEFESYNPKAVATLPTQAPASARGKSATSARGSGVPLDKNTFVFLGAAVVGLTLIGLASWYFFFAEAPSGRVEGVVTLDGNALELADLVFVGEEDPKLGSHPARTKSDGSYMITGPAAGGGVPPGKYKVIVNKLVLPDGKVPEGPDGDLARGQGLLRNVIPPHYSDPQVTTLRVVVKSGRNPVDLNLITSN